MLTRKHFTSLALVLKQEKAPPAICKLLAVWCARQNPAFDRARFLAACGVEE